MQINLSKWKETKLTAERVFFLTYGLYLFIQILSTTQFANYSFCDLLLKWVKVVAVLGIMSALLLRGKFKKKWIALSIIIAILSFIVLVFNERTYDILFLYIFLLTSGLFVSNHTLFKVYFVVASCVVLLTLLLYVAGVYKEDAIGDVFGERYRLYLGFHYTTYFPNYLFHILLVYFVIRKTKINIIETAVIIALNILAYELTDTKAVYICVYLLLALLWILRFCEKLIRTKFIQICLLCVMPVLAALSYLVAIKYNPFSKVWQELNELFSTRPSLMHEAYLKYGIPIFGTVVHWVTGRFGIERIEDYFYVDCSYYNIGVTYGLIVLILVVASFCFLMYRAHKERKFTLCVVLLVLAIHSFTDPQLFDLNYDPFLLLLVPACISRKPLPLAEPARRIPRRKRKKSPVPAKEAIS